MYYSSTLDKSLFKAQAKFKQEKKTSYLYLKTSSVNFNHLISIKQCFIYLLLRSLASLPKINANFYKTRKQVVFWEPTVCQTLCQIILYQLLLKLSWVIPGSERCPRERNSNLLQYFCLKNPKDRRAWWATVQRVPKSQTWLSTHAQCRTKVL